MTRLRKVQGTDAPPGEQHRLRQADALALHRAATKAARDELEGQPPDAGSPAAIGGVPVIVNGRLVYAADAKPLTVGGRILAYRYKAPRREPTGRHRGEPAVATREKLAELRDALGPKMTQQALADALLVDRRAISRLFPRTARTWIPNVSPWELYRDHGLLHDELADKLD